MVTNRKNTFEILGYDFMIDENFKVWLIEVNASPQMDANNNAILRTLIKSMLTDLAKVVIDYPKDKKADTGDFFLAHRAKHEVQRPLGKINLDLKVIGTKVGATGGGGEMAGE